MPLTEQQRLDFERKLMEIAINDFEEFCRLGGANIERAFICIELGKGKSLQQIATKLGIHKSKVARRKTKCPAYRGKKI